MRLPVVSQVMKLMQRLGTLLKPIAEPVVNFNDGPTVNNPQGNPEVQVGFFVGDHCVYETAIKANEWAKAGLKYLVDWRIEISAFGGLFRKTYYFDPAYRNVRINIDSRSLGDTLAWVPQVAAFKECHPNCNVYLSTFWDDFEFQKSYPKLEFIRPDEDLENCYAVFNLGFFFGDIPDRHPVDPRTVPLAQVASDILGIRYEEQKPVLPAGTATVPTSDPYVCIATTSTAACKHWLYEDGWQTLVDYLEERGLRTVVIQKEKTDLRNVIDSTGDFPITRRITELDSCEFFIGLGSGLSWLAWAVSKPVVLISGFSQSFAEFEDRCIRVSDPNACNGCWNDSAYSFDRKNWDWCPRHEGSDRQHECAYSISPEMVMSKIAPLLLAIETRYNLSQTKGDHNVFA